MAEYRISGVWKNSNDVITHYAFHTVNGKEITRTSKKSKADAIELLEKKEILLLSGFGITQLLIGKKERL